jgi:hypothetical protein
MARDSDQRDEQTETPTFIPSRARDRGTGDKPKTKPTVEIEDLGEDDVPDLLETEDDDDEPERAEAASTAAAAAYTAFSETNGRRDPKSLREAMCSPEWPEWEKAIQVELNTLEMMGTWELADRPEGRKPITNKWVFVKKYDKDGNPSSDSRRSERS